MERSSSPTPVQSAEELVRSSKKVKRDDSGRGSNVDAEMAEEFPALGTPSAGEEDDLKCPRILLSAEEKRRIRFPWRDAIIVKILDINVGYMYLRNSLVNKWKPKGEFTMIDIGHEYYVIKFQDMEDLTHVMTEGPWLTGENYLTIQRWRSNFIASEEEIRFVRGSEYQTSPWKILRSWDFDSNRNKLGRVFKIDKTTTLLSEEDSLD
ncbi:hypothetical protein V2J09_022222 [Rumex salicifolius]